MENSYRKSAEDTLLIGFSTILNFAASLVLLPLLTKGLGAQAYGTVSQVNATVGLVLPFIGLGLTDAMIRFLSAEKSRAEIKDGFYSVALIVSATSIFVALLMIALAQPISKSFFDGEINVVRLTGIMLFTDSVAPVYLSLIRTFQQVKRYTFYSIGDNLARIGLSVFLVLNGYGVFSIILAIVGVKVGILGLLFLDVRRQIGFKKPVFSRIREYLSYGLPTVPRSMGFWLIYVGDRWVISYFLGLTAVGIYSAAYGIGSLAYSVMSVLTFVLYATLPKLYGEGRMEEVKNHLSYSLKYLLALLIPFVFGAGILARQVLTIFSTSEMARTGYLLTPVIAAGFLILGVHGVFSHVLLLTKKTLLMAIIWVSAAGFSLGLNAILVPRIGIMGAAVTELSAFTLATGAVIYFSTRYLRFDINWLFIAKSLAAASVMSLVVWLMSPEGVLKTVLAAMVGLVVYIAVMILLRGFTKQEFRLFRDIIRRRKSPL